MTSVCRDREAVNGIETAAQCDANTTGTGSIVQAETGNPPEVAHRDAVQARGGRASGNFRFWTWLVETSSIEDAVSFTKDVIKSPGVLVGGAEKKKSRGVGSAGDVTLFCRQPPQ
jgi:hypothetical protein